MQNITKFVISYISCASCPQATCIFCNCNHTSCKSCWNSNCHKDIKEARKSFLLCCIRRKIFRSVYEKFWYWSD